MPRPKKAKKKSEFFEEVVQINRVNRVVKGGRRLRFRATVVIGDKVDRVGVGVGKADEVTTAVHKAIKKAKVDMISVPIHNETIPHKIDTKVKATKIRLIPAASGTGIIAGGAVRTVLELAGIKNILSKTYGSTNRINTTKATIEALKSLIPAKESEKPAPKENIAAKKPDQKVADKKTEKKPEKKPTEKSKTKPAAKKPDVKKPDAKPKAESKEEAKKS